MNPTDIETARSLGFVNCAAWVEYCHQRDREADRLEWLLTEVCNLREQVKSLVHFHRQQGKEGDPCVSQSP